MENEILRSSSSKRRRELWIVIPQNDIEGHDESSLVRPGFRWPPSPPHKKWIPKWGKLCVRESLKGGWWWCSRYHHHQLAVEWKSCVGLFKQFIAGGLREVSFLFVLPLVVISLLLLLLRVLFWPHGQIIITISRPALHYPRRRRSRNETIFLIYPSHRNSATEKISLRMGQSSKKWKRPSFLLWWAACKKCNNKTVIISLYS